MAFEDSIVYFAENAMRTRVIGRDSNAAECWDLAEEALRFAGAKTSKEVMGKNFKSNSNYKWGESIKTFGQLKPGDIIQFNKYHYHGAGSKDEREYQDRGSTSQPRHTAIVKEVIGGPNNAVEVYEQNVPPGGAVQTAVLYFKSGGEITVSGQFQTNWWFYRATN
jgi:hypothetical protein